MNAHRGPSTAVFTTTVRKQDWAPSRRAGIASLAKATAAAGAFATVALAASGCVSREDSLRDANTPYVGVFVDARTEKAMGPFPYDRAVYARAVTMASKLGAKAVVVKFFLDKPASDKGDAALALAARQVPVFLQARIDADAEDSSALDPRFALPDAAAVAFSNPAGAQEGWIPTSGFQAAASGVGFVDLFAEPPAFFVPTAVKYRARVFPSLTYSVLRFALGEALALDPGKSLRMGEREVALTPTGETYVALSEAPDPPVYSLSDFLSQNISPGIVAGKIVVLGYEGEKLAPLRVPGGEMAPHRAFLRSLASLHARLAPE